MMGGNWFKSLGRFKGFAQILNFDATQIFNISNNKLVQGIGAKAENMHFHGDDYKENI